MKRALAALTATAMIATGVAAPANAASVRYLGSDCVIGYTQAERNMFKDRRVSDTFSPLEAKFAIPQVEKKLKEGQASYDANKSRMTTAQRAQAQQKLNALKSIISAYSTCAAKAPNTSAADELSTPDGELTPAGIGTIVGAVILVIVAIGAAAAPALQSFLR